MIKETEILDRGQTIWYNQKNERFEGFAMQKRIEIPAGYEDIASELQRRRRSVLLPSILWAAMILLLEYLYLWQYFSERINAAVSLLIAVILTAAYPIRRGILTLIADRGWEGEVRDVKKRSYIHFKNLWARSFSGMTTRIEGHLYLRGREGRSVFLERRFPIRRRFILRSGDAELPYQSGDFLRCYRGCAYPVIVKRPGSDGYPPRVCVFCGKTECDRSRAVCDFCGFSLVTPHETVNFVEYGM